MRDHFTRLEAFEKAKNLYGQASGTKKCLEVIKAGGTEIPQEMIDVNCLNGIQSTKMEEVRNRMAKDVLFRFGLKGYKSDKKMKEQQDQRVTRSKR